MDQGVIYYRNHINALFVVELSDHYVVFENFDLKEFQVGDHVSGNFNELGSVRVLNADSHRMNTVIIRLINSTLTMAMKFANMEE